MRDMMDDASKAAFEQWGRRHEAALIRWHRFKMSIGWIIIGIVVFAFIGTQFLLPFIADHFLVILGVALLAVAAVGLFIARAVGNASLPRPPRGFR